MNRFISFEGADGCGKTTQWNLLGQYLQERGEEVVLTREPGGTRLAEMLRHQLLHGGETVVPRAEVLLFGAARAQHIAQLIRPALESGAWVLCDRFTDSTFAYQSAGLGLDSAFIDAMNRFATAELAPALTLLFEVAPEIAHARRISRDGATDKIEARGDEFQSRVRAGFAALAQREPQRIVTLDGAPDVASVQKNVLRVLRERGILS